MICLNIQQFHMINFNGSVDIAIEPEARCKFHETITLLLCMLYN
jgi:hypothetical protein